MYQVLPNTKQDAVSKPLAQHVKDILSGTPTRPLGFYEFIIVSTATFWYFFLTGIAIIMKRDIPKAWLNLGTKLEQGKMKKVLVKAVEKKEPSIRVEEINKPVHTHDAAGNPLPLSR